MIHLACQMAFVYLIGNLLGNIPQVGSCITGDIGHFIRSSLVGYHVDVQFLYSSPACLLPQQERIG